MLTWPTFFHFPSSHAFLIEKICTVKQASVRSQKRLDECRTILSYFNGATSEMLARKIVWLSDLFKKKLLALESQVYIYISQTPLCTEEERIVNIFLF